MDKMIFYGHLGVSERRRALWYIHFCCSLKRLVFYKVSVLQAGVFEAARLFSLLTLLDNMTGLAENVQKISEGFKLFYGVSEVLL